MITFDNGKLVNYGYFTYKRRLEMFFHRKCLKLKIYEFDTVLMGEIPIWLNRNVKRNKSILLFLLKILQWKWYKVFYVIRYVMCIWNQMVSIMFCWSKIKN